MSRLRILLLRSGIIRLARPLYTPLSKLTWFFRFDAWARENKHLPLNDLPSKEYYNKRYRLFDYILSKHSTPDDPLDYFEFGVADGATFTWWLTKIHHPDSRFYGFDTFEGLPEDWGIHKKGAFTNDGRVPSFDDTRQSLYKGLFQQTLPAFLTGYANGRQKLILLDADLYSSTLFVLTAMAPHLQTGDLLIFDEFFSPRHEFRAYCDFIRAYPHIRLHALAAINNFTFVAFSVERLASVEPLSPANG